MWTNDELITELEELATLHERGVVALDMETAAIAHACEQRGVPWSVFRAISDPTWRPPYTPAVTATGPAESLATQLENEILLLRGSHELWVSKYSRTTVGLSGLPIEECTRYVAEDQTTRNTVILAVLPRRAGNIKNSYTVEPCES